MSLLMLVAGCAGERQPPALGNKEPEHAEAAARQGAGQDRGADPASLPGWADDDLAGLGDVLKRQCGGADASSRWPQVCRNPLPGDTASLRRWLERNFRAWQMAGPDGSTTGVITGYFEPVISGSLRQESAAQTPVYAPPDPADRGRTMSRGEIEVTGLPMAKALLWLDDPVDAFFLHVQGSGRVRLRDGPLIRIGFAGHNGQRYVAIGKVLIERGELRPEQADMQGIRRWLHEHLATDPAKARQVMRANPRYIFFRRLDDLPAGAGPPGSIGVALTPGRSIATDPSAVPPGALLFLATTLPAAGSAPARNFERVVVNQDTGAAIVGQVRADLFTGTGDAAGELAGRMRQPGRLWLLWPAGSPPPTSSAR